MRLVILLLGISWAGLTLAESGQHQYYEALALIRQDRVAEARPILQRIADEQADDPFADDALAELARLDEEVLGKADRALSTWKKLLQQHPDSRLARRAQARIDFLSRHLDQGDEVLARYQAIVRAKPADRRLDGVERMEELLAQHPDFSLRPEGLIWMAGELSHADEYERARQVLGRLVTDYPDREAGRVGLQQLAQLNLDRGDLDAAESAYRSLAAQAAGEWQEVAAAGLTRVAGMRWRGRARIAALSLWVLAMAALTTLLLNLQRRGRLIGRDFRPPLEAIIFTLILAGLLVTVHGRAQDTFWALLWMGVLCLPLLLLNGWILRGLRLGGLGLSFWLAGLTATWAAAVYASLELAGLIGQVLHTIQFGTD